MDNYAGKRLGNYHLSRLLGTGGYAAVYLAEHIYLKTQAAIKVLRISLDDAALARFLAEARTIAHLDHPNIVRTLEFGVQDSTAYLVMSYAPNGTVLHRYPRGSIVPLHVVVQYVRQLAEALQYAHAHGVIHRDVKPENILLGRDDEILLGDFGLAVMSASSPSWQPVDRAGTVGYMAPEQIEGQPGKASDQYGLGVVVYEWLCGSLPFAGLDREIVARQLHIAPRPLRERAPSVPLAIEQVVMKALARNPSARFLSVLHFAQALEEAYRPYKLVQLLPTDVRMPEVGSGTPALKSKVSGAAETEPALARQPVSELDDHNDRTAQSPLKASVRGAGSEPGWFSLQRISKRLMLAGLASCIAASVVSAGVIWSLHNLSLAPSSAQDSVHIVRSGAARMTSGKTLSHVAGASVLPSGPSTPRPTPTQNAGSTARTTAAYTATPTPQATPTVSAAYTSSSSTYFYSVSSASTPVSMSTPTPATTPVNAPNPTATPVVVPTSQAQSTPPGKGRLTAPGQLKKEQS